MSDMQLRSIPVVTISELEADPHGVFRHYRPITPVIARENTGFVVLRALDIDTLVRDKRVRQTETELLAMRGVTEGKFFDSLSLSMLFSNGDTHRNRRSPFTRAFAASMIEALRPTVRQTAESLIDEWAGETQADLLSRYASLIPARVISSILGLPNEDIPHFTRLVYSLSRFLGFTLKSADLPEIQRDTQELWYYVEALLSRRRTNLGDDLISRFLTDAEEQGELSAAEIIAQIVLLIAAGTDTTRIAIATQTSLLLEHRAQWEDVCANPGLVRAAVAEALRFEPSVASMARVAKETIILGDGVIPAGGYITLSTMSGSRDETIYSEPDVFNIHRMDGRRVHMVFGAGVHRCLGEALAWLELEEGLLALTQRLPNLTLAGPPTRPQGHASVRRMEKMLVTVR